MSQEILHWPHQNSAGLLTKAAAFTRNSRDAPPSRAKAENSNISALEYNHWEQPIDSAIRENKKLVLFDSINKFHWRKQTSKAYIKLCNFYKHMSTLRNFMAHWIHFIYNSNTGPLTQAAICCRIWLGYFEKYFANIHECFKLNLVSLDLKIMKRKDDTVCSKHTPTCNASLYNRSHDTS